MRMRWFARLLFALSVVLQGIACAPDLPTPKVIKVEPSWGYNGEETPVLIRGSGFFPAVHVSGGKDVEVNRQYRAFLETDPESELEGVTISDYSLLEARVPPGLSPGRYDLRVQSPTGAEDTLGEAFTVTDTRADHLDAVTDGITYQVNQYALIHLTLLDPEGNEVASPLEVSVTVASGDEADGLRFAEGTLDEQQATSDVKGIQGRLGDNGQGYVAITSSVPEELWLNIGPTDPDSVISGTQVFLAFTAGDVRSVRIDLPTSDYSTQAGVAFDAELTLLDAYGNPTSGQAANLLLYEECGSYQQSVQVVDNDTITITPTGATGQECTENRIYAVGTSGSITVQGESEAFQVTPGDPTHLDVRASPPSVRAGTDSLRVLVSVKDAWDNTVDSYEGSVTLRDDAGGLDPDTSRGEQSCDDIQDGLAVCRATLWTASESDKLTASTDDGLEGTSNTFAVVAGVPARVDVGVGVSPLVAGAPFDVTVRVLDDYGNPVSFDPAGADVPEFDDGSGTVSCTWTGSLAPTGTEGFLCTTKVAGTGKTLTVTLPTRGVSGESSTFDVDNAELSVVSVDLGGMSEVTAGEPFTVTLEGTDAYGNPYIVQSNPTVDISDASGTVDPASVTLDASGEAVVTLAITRAITADVLEVSQGGTVLGTSSSFDVVPGAVDHFEVMPERDWAWLGDALSVTIDAEDAYDNVVTSFTGTVTLSSAKGLGSDVSTSAFTDGEATVDFTFDTAGVGDTLEASDGTSSGTSAPIDAVSSSCANPPVAHLEVAGGASAVLCRSGGTTGSTTLSASASTAGSAALSFYHFSTGQGEWTRTTSASTTAEWTSEGRFTAELLVVAADGCGSSATATVYVADDDGEPAGPVSVSVADSSLTAGSSSAGSTTVTFVAQDCAGAASAGGTLLVRADLGELSSTGTTSLVASGSGLELTLDSTGTGEVAWSMASTDDAGTATVYTGVDGGMAFGSGTVTVTGDRSRPTVLSVDPSGTQSDLVDSIDIAFSEAMLTSSVNSSSVQLTDPSGNLVGISSISFPSDDADAVVTLDRVADLGSGTWTLTLSPIIRDASGNRLDGTWSGTASPMVLQFGAVSDSAPDITACSVSVSTFRPDGDDGTGSEADEVDIALTASGPATWWREEVTDSSGNMVLMHRASAGGSSTGTVTWDGRDQDGFVVDNGTYTLSFAAEDDYWNTGVGCSVDLTVQNRITAP